MAERTGFYKYKYLSQGKLQFIRLEEENRALKEALTWACNRLHQWSPWNNGCHFRACGACPLKGYAKEESEWVSNKEQCLL